MLWLVLYIPHHVSSSLAQTHAQGVPYSLSIFRRKRVLIKDIILHSLKCCDSDLAQMRAKSCVVINWSLSKSARAPDSLQLESKHLYNEYSMQYRMPVKSNHLYGAVAC